MATTSAARIARLATRHATTHTRPRLTQTHRLAPTTASLRAPIAHTRSFSVTPSSRVSLMPESENPPPPKNASSSTSPAPQQATEITDEEYRDLAEDYLNAVYDRAEAVAETREDVEVEYSAGVLNITFPPHGTYVLNKQPPNKQIWLSSPVSGPKRYDWVRAGEGQSEKEGTGSGEWVYLRDGTNLTALLRKELGIVVDALELEVQQKMESKKGLVDGKGE